MASLQMAVIYLAMDMSKQCILANAIMIGNPIVTGKCTCSKQAILYMSMFEARKQGLGPKKSLDKNQL